MTRKSLISKVIPELSERQIDSLMAIAGFICIVALCFMLVTMIFFEIYDSFS